MEKVLATRAAKRGLGLPAMEERVRLLGVRDLERGKPGDQNNVYHSRI